MGWDVIKLQSVVSSGVATIYACMLKHTHNFQKKNHRVPKKC